MRIFLSLLGVVAGFLLTWKAEWIFQNFGSVPWAEKYLGTEGGSRLFYKLLGMLIIIFSVFYMFGTTETIIMWIFGPLIHRQ